MKTKHLYLVNPAHGSSFWGLNYACELVGATYSTLPLALPTIAALTPEDWEITIVDENVEPIDLDYPADVVGITGMNVQAARAFVLADAFRRRGRTVVIGGPFATLQPDRCAPHADVVMVGESERTWPQFCRDYEANDIQSSYVERGTIDMSESPVPRFDLLHTDLYASFAIQTTRGCPFSCDFCDIIIMQGRRVRTKPVDQVMAEVEASARCGTRAIFFTDDNFVGNLKYARELLDRLATYRTTHPDMPILYSQATVNIADRPALLERMVDAGFTRIFIGIETPDQDSLLEAGKKQNTHGDLLERIYTIQRAGLMVWAGMIVGFDHDDVSIFERQAKFLDEAGIAVAMVGMLNAPPRTPLYNRLQREGRIDPGADWTDNCAFTNIIPARMSRAQLMEGYADLVTEIYRQEPYARRVVSNILRMKPAKQEVPDLAQRLPHLEDWTDFFRAMGSFTLSSDPVRRRHFLPNFLRVLRHQPTRIVEAAIHLGLWLHFERYAPELATLLRQTAQLERVRERQRVFEAKTPLVLLQDQPVANAANVS